MEKNNLENTGEVEETKTDSEKVEMTKEELDKMLQSEADRRVTSAIQKAQVKWEQEYSQKIQAAKSEAEKLAKMSEEEKYKAELEKKEKDIAERERRVYLSELKSETVGQLAELNIPTKFTDFLLRDTAEETKANINTFSELWQSEMKAQIEKQVEDKLKGSTPKRGNGNTAAMSKEEFSKLPMSERLTLKQSNPDLFNQIMSK